MTKSESMSGVRPTVRMGSGAWIAWGVIGAGFLYLAANTYAMELGAAHHDAFCPDHGWAAQRI